jgi:hypothetical protein
MKAGINKTEVKIILLFVLIFAVVMLTTTSFISANCAVSSIGGPKTVISGVITDQNNNLVNGAKITIVCNHNGFKNPKSGKSASNGEYSTVYISSPQQTCNGQCYKGDTVTVTATKNGITNSNTGVVNSEETSINVELNSSVPPVVPEFGTAVGVLTVLGALGAFFVVRKKGNIRVRKK